MEVGNIPKFEQFPQLSTHKVKGILKTDPSFLLKDELETNEIIKKDQVKKQDSSQISDVKANSKFSSFKEAILPSSNFGFNEESEDFFVKVTRNAFVDNKYPTDEMMRMKLYLKDIA